MINEVTRQMKGQLARSVTPLVRSLAVNLYSDDGLHQWPSRRVPRRRRRRDHVENHPGVYLILSFRPCLLFLSVHFDHFIAIESVYH